MKITEHVKVGGFTYDVSRPDEAFPLGDNVCDGSHTFASQQIKVAKTGTQTYQNMVFLHEICHAIVNHYCDNSFIDEEKFVEAFSKGLYQVITDNREIFINE